MVDAPPRVVSTPREEVEERSRAAANKPVDSELREQLDRIDQACLGMLSDNVRSGLGQYFDRYGDGPRMRREPENDGSTVLSVSASSDACSERLTGCEDDAELVEAGRRFVAATSALDTTTRAASDYYRELRFVRDGMSEGRVFHARIVEEYAAWREAWSALGTIVDARFAIADRRLVESIGDEQASRVLVERVRFEVDAYRRWYRRGERSGGDARLTAIDDAVATLANAFADDPTAFPERTRFYLLEAQNFQTAVRRHGRSNTSWWGGLEARRVDRGRNDLVNAYARLYPMGSARR